jgi:tRNA threonylcarbamoyladenosine biosynthesis protein TsaB
MKILAVDTTFGACSVFVGANRTQRAHRFAVMERGHAEALAPMVEDAMREAGLSYSEIDRLGVTTGPGTFTGQRVGLAFMRGLRIALKRPLIGVTSLAAMAHQAMHETGAPKAVAIHDARRDEVYFEVAGLGVGLPAARLMKFHEAVEATVACARNNRLAIAGTAAKRIHEQCAAKGLATTLSTVTAPDARWVAQLCAEMPVPAEVPRPLYLREPDAKLPGVRS